MTRKSPEATYRAERDKARRERTTPQDTALEEARREFEKMLEAERTARKGGRPKKGTTK